MEEPGAELDVGHVVPVGSTGDLLGRDFSLAVVLFHEAVAGTRGLTAADNKTLEVLVRHGPMSATQLAERVQLSPGAITGLIDRLQQAGFVRREPDLDDRRRIVVRVTEEHLAEMGAIFAALGTEVGAVLGRYDERELAAINDFMVRMTGVLREQTALLEGRQQAGGPVAPQRQRTLPTGG